MAYQEEERDYLRISWSSVVAGGVTALAASALLNLLGIGLGFTTINPVTESDPLSGLATGTIIWWIIANLIALFLGGMVAGHSAGFLSKTDGGLHGFLSWCVYAAVLLFFITTATGAVISGLAGTVSSIFGGGQEEVVVRVENQRQQAQDQQALSFDNIREKFVQLVERAEQFDVLPSDAAENVQETLNQGTADLRETWQELNLDQNIEEFFNDLSVDIGENGNLSINVEGDILNREKTKDYLAENTDLSEQEIEENINEWNQNMEEAISEVEKLYQETRQEIEQQADQLADTIATVSLISFFALVLGAIAGWAGGMVAAGSNPVVVKKRETIHD